jgi:hypothetical protein
MSTRPSGVDSAREVACERQAAQWPRQPSATLAAVTGPEVDPPESEGVVVVHTGQRRALTALQVLTFGRAASCTVCLDAQDRGISRLAGSVEHGAGTWWVCNRSTVRALTVVDDLGIRTVVAPGRRVAVTGPVTVVVEGSARRHALEVWPERGPEPGQRPDLRRGDEADPLPTSAAGEVVISALDRLAMVALFARYLETFPHYEPHPRTYAEAAAVLAWPRSTLVKRIEYVRTRLTNAGVPNLLGENALEYLAEWALTTGVLTRSDLELIKGHDGQMPESPDKATPRDGAEPPDSIL